MLALAGRLSGFFRRCYFFNRTLAGRPTEWSVVMAMEMRGSYTYEWFTSARASNARLVNFHDLPKRVSSNLVDMRGWQEIMVESINGI
jgi:hypothetical protein